MGELFCKLQRMFDSRWCALGQLAIAAGVAVLLWREHPSHYRFLPPCPSAALLHVYCPGCGSTRAVHFLLRGEVGQAWRHNPALLLIGVPVALWHAATLVLRVLGRRVPGVDLPPIVIWGLAIGLVMYGVARNLPLAGCDALRPPPAPVRGGCASMDLRQGLS